MIAGALGALLVVLAWGRTPGGLPRTLPLGVDSTHATAVSVPDQLLHVLLALAAVLVTGQLLGRLFAAIRQPPVIGEVLAGVLLGPSLLGRVVPGLSDRILPPSAAPALGLVAELGVVLYMFLVGLEFDLDRMRTRARATIAIAHASIATPLVLGAALALPLYPILSSTDVSFTSFALFLGVAMSITAFPVLARILADRGMHLTDLGQLALACAAVADVTAWCILAVVIGVVQAKVSSAALTLILTLLFVALMWTVARPLVARWVNAAGTSVTRETMGLLLGLLLASAVTTDAIGVHAIFGAFLFGVMVPSESPVARALTVRLQDVVTVLLLPAFFALTGLRVQIGLVSGVTEWIIVLVIVLVATVGKVGGTIIAARLAGMAWRPAAGLGVLMNTRGLMELIVLNIGLDLRIISPTLFTLLVLMALATTVMASPVLDLLGSRIPVRPELQSTRARSAL